MAKWVLIVFFLTIATAQQYTMLGSFPVYSTAFLNIFQWKSSGPFQLLATGFGIFSGDAVFVVNDLASILGNVNNTQPFEITSDITWPNEADMVPIGAIQGTPLAIWVAGGFLVPGSSTGAINIIPADATGSNFDDPIQVSQDKSGWFYHTLAWFDVNKDGTLDIIAARATKPLFGSGAGELVWYEQPSGGLANVPWNVNHIVDGPDFFFVLHDVNGDGVPEIIATEFFSQQLVLYATTSGDWSDPTSVVSIVIDPILGPGFDVKIADVNGDGKMDVLATNNENNPSAASVFAYDIPVEWKAGNWTRYTLANGFIVRSSNANAGCPGTLTPFYPKQPSSGRPWILLAGDDSQYAYEMRPVPGFPWKYTTTTIINAQATVGQIATADINGDGYAEFFVPAYDTGLVYVYTYAPM